MGRQSRSRGQIWEVALVDLGRVSGVELLGTLLVANAESGKVLYAAPVPAGDDLREHLRRVSGKARAIRAFHEQVAMFEPAARDLGAVLVPRSALPIVEQIATLIAGQLASSTTAQMPTVDDAPAWRAIGAALLRAAPWRVVDDGLLFKLSSTGTPIDGWVGVVLGWAGEQLGLAFYRSVAAYFEFRAADIDTPFRLPDGDFMVVVTLDPLAELPPDLCASAREMDLCVGEYALLPAVLSEASFRSIPNADAPAWRAACQAVIDAWKTHGDDLLHQRTSTQVNTSVGVVQVQTELVSDPLGDVGDRFLLEGIDANLRIESGGAGGSPTLLISGTKANAELAAARLGGVDGYALAVTPQTLTLLAAIGGVPVGALAHLAYVADLHAALTGDLHLTIAKGGVRVKKVRPSDVILATTLRRINDQDLAR